VAIAPAAIDPNYFIGDFLLEQGETAKADAGRRREIESDLAKLEKKIKFVLHIVAPRVPVAEADNSPPRCIAPAK
jgi:hypothetical protein